MLFSALGNCATVVPAQPYDVYHRAPSCTVMAATPSILNNLPTPSADNSIFSNMHTVILGGETATSDLLGSWIDAGVRVLTAYGATETTSMGCIHKVERDPQTGQIDPFLIGGVMEQSPIFLLNCDFTIIEEDFVEGEIFIGGNGVARGYYKDELRTKDNFVYWSGLRVYRTGDRGRWVRGPEGDRVIEFRGRKDRTVKNSGFLVNLDRDVEDGLYHAGVSLGIKSVHAVATENGIIAVVTPSGVNTAALLTRAKQSMCMYCIPYRIEAVEDFPRSSNGKVQPRRVLDIITRIDEGKDHQHAMSVTPSTCLEKQITDGAGEDKKLKKVLRAAAEVLSGSDEKLRKIQSKDSFIEMGGSSLLAFKFAFVLRQLNLHISVRDLFKCQTFSEVAQIASMNPSSEYAKPGIVKDTTIAQGLADLRREAQSTPGLADKNFDVGPLTSLQLELAIPTLADKSRGVNQVKLAYSGKYARVIERAWRTVWQSEQVFRTEISLTIACGVQIVHMKTFRKPRLEIYSSYTDYESAVKESSMSVGLGCRLEFFAYRQTAVSTNISSGICIPKEMDELTVVLTIHHSLMDGCSLKLLLDKVELAARGQSLSCGPSSIDANLGLITMQKIRDAEARDFFASYLRDIPLDNSATERHLIGAQRKREGMEQCMKTSFVEPSAGIEDVTAFANQSCVSVACIYYTAWAMAISALESSSTVVVGAVFSNRATLPGHENTIGPYMSTLPILFRFDVDETVAARLQRTMDDLTMVGEYSWARSDQVGLGRRMGNLLAMQLPLPDERSRPPPIWVESLENSDFPLSMLVETNGNLRVMYDNTQFDDQIIQRVGEHFKHAVHCLLHEDRVEDCMRINKLQETVLERAVQVRSDQGEQTVKKALERSVDRFFGQTALEDYSGAKITYYELDKLTNVIAHHINSSLSDARPIALYGDGTTGWILGLLGILKTGRTYVPLDPQWPMERRAAVCEKSGAVALVLPSAAQEHEAPVIAGMKVLAVNSILSDDDGKNSLPRLPDTASPDSDLVIVFTSGTTGTPKGVPISNRGFLALQSNPEATMFAAPGRRIAQFMSPAFDYCNVEIFSALLHGATLVLRDPFDPYANLRKVNTATITPSVLAVLDLDEFSNLEIVRSFLTARSFTN
jgi:gliotoxin/aspirochlorine biosynthesis peptide synthetase